MAKHVAMRTILICQAITPLSLLESLKGHFHKIHYYPSIDASSPAPPLHVYNEIDAIFSFRLPHNLTSISQTPKLKLFQLLSAGSNHVENTPFLQSVPKSSELVLASASGIHVSAIAEHVIGTTLMLNHKLNELVIFGHNEQRWKVPLSSELGGGKGLFIRELRDQGIGVVGYGHIGREVARLAQPFGCKILALTRSGKPTKATGYLVPHTGDPDGTIPSAYYPSASPQEFLSQCDVVVNTLLSSAGTVGYFGEKEFRAMKDTAVFVNIGRGDTVVQTELVKALQNVRVKEGEKIREDVELEEEGGRLRIGGASLDVTDPEPLPNGHPLYTMSNVVLTPHMSGLSTTYLVQAVDLLLQNVTRLREGKGCLNAIRGKGE